MWSAVAAISFLVFIVAILGTLVMAIKRNPVWKKWLATIGISFLMMIVGVINAPTADTTTTNTQSAAVTQSQESVPASTETSKPSDQPANTTTLDTNTTAQTTPSTQLQSQTPTNNTTSSQSSTASQAVTPTATQSANNQDIIVYVGAKGTKYHYQNCRTLKDTKIPMSISEAKAKGYTACGVCHPPQ